jgi:hypothetical protein
MGGLGKPKNSNIPLGMKVFLAFGFWVITLLSAYWYGLKSKESSWVASNEHGSESLDWGLAEDEKMKLPSPTLSVLESNISATPFNASLVNEIEEIQYGQDKSKSLVQKLRSSNPVERVQAFAVLLEKPNAESIAVAKEAYESLPGGPSRFSELKLLSFAWGQVDPQSALTWAGEQEHWDKHVANESIMNSWAREDADMAILWAKENYEGKENPYFIGIINGLSETNLPKATDLMTDLPYGRVRGRSAHMLFEKVWNQGEEVAMHWAEHLPEGSLQNFAYGELGEKVARSDMPRAIEWVDSMVESPVKEAVSEDVSRELARQNPQDAGAWVLNMDHGNSQQVAIKEVAKIWSRQDPAATAEWINQFPEGANVDPAIEELVLQMSKTDPDGALTWAETISDPNRRKKVTQKVKKDMKSEDQSTKANK